MIKTFQEGRDIYATIASIAFNLPYKDCLEFNEDTHEFQPEGKERRSIAKILVLGVNYGMSTESIGQMLWKDEDISDEERTKRAKKIFDSVMRGFPQLANAISNAQSFARSHGYTETILGRRRHHPNMQLPMYEFKAMPGYVNPDIDPLDISTMNQKSDIPKRITDALYKELTGYKYFGQVVKRIKELQEEKIQVTNNNYKITEASRKIWNSIIQGSAADLTKLAMLKLHFNEEWRRLGGRMLVPVHDELIVEVPIGRREEGARILKNCMEEAGSFLPFAITCDIEETLRWYGVGVDVLLSFDKPETMSIDRMSESNIQWIQSRLLEFGYELPIISDGKKLHGPPAIGINGIWTTEMQQAIHDYITSRGITIDDFLDHIDRTVFSGEDR